MRDLVLNGVHSVGRVDLERSISTTESQCKNRGKEYRQEKGKGREYACRVEIEAV